MPDEEPKPVLGLGQSMPIVNPIEALENVTKQCLEMATRLISEAKDADTGAGARLLYEHATKELKLAIKSIDTLRKQAAKRG
jgi:hypothetical protein